MCSYCIESAGIYYWTCRCWSDADASLSGLFPLESALSFYFPALPVPDSVLADLYAEVAEQWRVTSAVLCAAYYGDSRRMAFVDGLTLADESVELPERSPRAVRIALQGWYRNTGRTLLAGWRECCEADDEASLSALIMLSGVLRHSMLTGSERRICRSIAQYQPPAGSASCSMAHWLRRQYRLLLWDQGAKQDVARWDAQDEYAVTLRTLVHLHGDLSAAWWMRREAPRQWSEDQTSHDVG